MGEHYYTTANTPGHASGQPMHWIVGANGKERATTLRDARKLSLAPSFSTVDSIRNKYQLNRYLMRDALVESYEFAGFHMEYDGAGAYADAVLAHLDETKGQRMGSDVGTEIHNSIESVCKGGEPTPGYEEHTEAALNEVARLFPDVEDWISERTFSNPMGFGGMVDLHSPSTGITVDFKTKDFWLGIDGNTPTRPSRIDGRPYRLDYDQYIQLAAYQRGLMLPANVGANVFISREHPGSVWPRVWTLDELAKGWKIFVTELELWVAVKGYDPSFVPGEEEAAA